MESRSPIDWALLPLKRYATFSGRSPRAEYWWFWLGYVALSIIINLMTRVSALFGILGLAYLGLIIPMIAVAVRRMHDTNRTGWWLLAPFVPYVVGGALMIPAMSAGGGLNPLAAAGPSMVFMGIGFILSIVIFVFTVLPGDRGPNNYGPDPYDPQNFEEVFA